MRCVHCGARTDPSRAGASLFGKQSPLTKRDRIVAPIAMWDAWRRHEASLLLAFVSERLLARMHLSANGTDRLAVGGENEMDAAPGTGGLEDDDRHGRSRRMER